MEKERLTWDIMFAFARSSCFLGYFVAKKQLAFVLNPLSREILPHRIQQQNASCIVARGVTQGMVGLAIPWVILKQQWEENKSSRKAPHLDLLVHQSHH